MLQSHFAIINERDELKSSQKKKSIHARRTISLSGVQIVKVYMVSLLQPAKGDCTSNICSFHAENFFT